MKLIISNDHIAATAHDNFSPSDTGQTVIDAPEGFDPDRMDEYRFIDGAITGPGVYPTLDHRKDAMLADLAARRYAVEVAGIVYVRASDSAAYGIATDRDSQPKLAAERAAATDGLRVADDVWKCLDLATGRYVFIPFTDAEVIAFANAARAHVSAAFKREGELAAQIEAAEDDAALDAIDIETGWPGP